MRALVVAATALLACAPSAVRPPQSSLPAAPSSAPSHEEPTALVARRVTVPLRRANFAIPPIARSDGAPISVRLVDARANTDDAELGLLVHYARIVAFERRYCFEDALAEKPQLDKLSVTLQLEILPSGELDSIAVLRSNAPADMAACVAEAFRTIEWPTRDDVRIVRVTYRFDRAP